MFVFIESVLTSLSPGAGRMSIDIVRRHLIFGQSFLAGYTNGRIIDFILMKCHQVAESITVLALKCRHQYDCAKELIQVHLQGKGKFCKFERLRSLFTR